MENGVPLRRAAKKAFSNLKALNEDECRIRFERSKKRRGRDLRVQRQRPGKRECFSRQDARDGIGRKKAFDAIRPRKTARQATAAKAFRTLTSERIRAGSSVCRFLYISRRSTGAENLNPRRAVSTPSAI